MKGHPELIATLNKALRSELAAIAQYTVGAGKCGNWGYDVLDHEISARARDEMEHVEKLVDRILFLEGEPIMALDPMNMGEDIEAIFEADHIAELGAITIYNDAIAQATKLGDHGTEEVFEDILEDEEEHLNKIEERLAQIQQMGIAVFLSGQVSGQIARGAPVVA
jgi:bacterioferritin